MGRAVSAKPLWRLLLAKFCLRIRWLAWLAGPRRRLTAVLDKVMTCPDPKVFCKWREVRAQILESPK